ncbi:MAG TPA: LysR family transcriptional regulator [Sneathiellales bacterium]|nr:LysR family transcriptional regulator [Sneathiellales bacterium]
MKDTRLRYALSAWKELSFTGAAEQLNISQSAISQQVSVLESELGFQLFDRVGNGIRPTYKGSLFLGHADEALTGSCSMFLPDISEQLDTPVYDSEKMKPGAWFQGPGIIEVRDTTIYVPREATVERDGYLNFILKL